MKIACFKQSTFNNNNAQRGASLLEAVAYLGIASLVLVGAVSLVGGAFTAAETNRASEEIVALRTATKKLFAGQAYPTTGMVSVLISAKAVPATLTVDSTGSTVTNGFGGTVTVAGSGTTPNTFTITYNSVPSDVCIGMVSGASGWTGLKIGTTEVTLPPVATVVQPLCSEGGSAKDVAFTSS